MTSWIYIFSRFTPEVLLFEVLLICVLASFYSLFWFARRRRLGIIEDSIPSGVLKHYLLEVMQNAKNIQGQLFGELASQGEANWTAPTVTVSGKMDPALMQKLAVLEAQISERDLAMQTLTQEKLRIEKDLMSAKASLGKDASSAAPLDNTELLQLREKVQILEDRLSEYSVIEDDLANLKRLQQENATLKNLVTTHGIKTSQEDGEAIAAPTKVAASPAPAAAKAAPPTPVLPEPEVPTSEEAAPTTPSPATNDQSFENLVDQVEKSLEDVPAPKVAEPAKVESAPTAPPPGGGDKSDAELVAEFEKMLKS